MNKAEYHNDKARRNMSFCGYKTGQQLAIGKELSFRKTALTWKVKARGLVGYISKLHKPKTTIGLSPGERWITYGSDKNVLFPLVTEKPEMYREKIVLPKTIPRKVGIEKRRLEYAKTSIDDILRERNISPTEVIPPNCSRRYFSGSSMYTFKDYTSTVPLEIFDNEDLECMTPEKWMAKGIVNNTPYSLPAVAYVPAPHRSHSRKIEDLQFAYQWSPVAVTGYNDETKTWSVVTLDHLKMVYNLPRIYIFFKAENPKHYGNRLAEALRIREENEMELRLQLYTDSMKIVGLPEMSPNIIAKIDKFYASKTKSGRFAEMMKDLALDYKRTLCEMELRTLATGKFSVYFPLPIKKVQVFSKTKTLPIETNMNDFPSNKNFFRWLNLFVIPNTFDALYDVVSEGLKTETQCLFAVAFRRGVSLEDFRVFQVEQTKRTIRNLSELWLKTTSNHVKTSLQTAPKSWYDIYEKDWNLYCRSKLYRLLELIKFRMQGSLYEMIMNSVEKYLDLLATPCKPTLRCRTARNLMWGPDLTNSIYSLPYGVSYIFTVTLSLNDKNAYYSITPESFITVITELFDDALEKCHFLRQIQPKLLENLKFPPGLYLSSVGLLHPVVVAAKEKLIDSYKCAIMPLKAYLREFNQYVPFYATVPSEYIKKLKEENRSFVQIKSEISYHLNEKMKLENCLPNDIVIGPFLVKVDVLRQFLINKRNDMARRVMDMYAEVLSERVDAINTVYRGIMSKLIEKPQSIEHILSVQKFLTGIPDMIERESLVLEDILRDYEVLDYFFYAINDEDFTGKYDAICGPMRINTQIELTVITLEEDTDKFFRVQQNDESSLDERIEAMSSMVSHLYVVNDITKIVDTAIEVRRLYKQILEAISLSKMLQSRQVLFEIPVRTYSEISELLEKFEPYYILWGAASDSVRGLEAWLTNPLMTIDLDAMNKVLTENLHILNNCFVLFEDNPLVLKVVVYVRDLLEKFKPLAVLAKAVKNPDMQEEQWEFVTKKTGVKLTISPIITINNIKDSGAIAYADFIADISTTATREFKIAEALRLKESNERFFKALLQDDIVINLKKTYRKGLTDYIDDIIEEILVQAEESTFLIDVAHELVERANWITYQNIATNMRDIIDKMIIKKAHF